MESNTWFTWKFCQSKTELYSPKKLISNLFLFLKKFLRSHPDLFEINGNRVRLIPQQNAMDIDEFGYQPMDFESSCDAISTDHWFCFDDSIVTSVRRSTIEKHFQMKDCPYMLFYRLKTQQEYSFDRQKSIPQWLIEEINENNRKLKEQRYINV